MPPSAESKASAGRKQPLFTLIAALAIGAAAAAAWSNSLSGPFVLDDGVTIIENATIRHLFPLHKVLYFPIRGSSVDGRPVVNLSLAVNYAFGGLAVEGYHIFNLLAHTAAGLVLLGILRRTLALPAIPDDLRARREWIALFVATIWTVHPIQTASVTFVIQRSAVLAGLFYLLTLYCLIRAVGSERSLPWQAATVSCCLVGMGCKEVMATAPVVLVLYDRTFLAGSFREAFRKRWKLHVACMGCWFPLALLMIMSRGRAGTCGFGRVSALQYLLTQGENVLHYLWLCVYPHPLVFDYGKELSDLDGASILAFLVVGSLVATTVFLLVRAPSAGFLGAWFFLILGPTSSFVPVVNQTAGEHRMYLPSAAVVAALIFLLFRGIGRVQRFRHVGTIVPAVVLVIVAVVLAAVTHRRNIDYRSAESLWSDTVAKRPCNLRGVSALTDTLARNGKVEEALRVFDLPMSLHPNPADVRVARSRLWISLGQWDAALRDLHQVVEIDPRNHGAHKFLAWIYERRGDTERALKHRNTLIEVDPTLGEFWCDRGTLFYLMGQPDKAFRDLLRGLRLTPYYAPGHMSLGNLFLSAGQEDLALESYRKATYYNACLDPAHYWVSYVHFRRGELEEAEAAAREALQWQWGRNSEYFVLLGLVLSKQARYREAGEAFEEACRASPHPIVERSAIAKKLLSVNESRLATEVLRSESTPPRTISTTGRKKQP